MAQSKAKKQRSKWQKQGKLNPEINRLGWNGVIPVERKTPTLAERREKLQHKHKNKWNLNLPGSSDGSICFFIELTSA
ncbi:hypothetical protein [Paenibacillus radicis (ex Xue et al. 2023)]|uniref:Uncharacterized protein n=1 Tax=Paenibacillus radicis (ex Xue et al. 2023) TaxID=2972489 RepID=A0ABT1YCW9_9BACL|nr:hypothetical protein [Paenibacillus radicis (ex Xue et al. 2023)]MCR8631022.1 hypothetical protein [Paenibacillus radicis (ex Xue et al. 2023)]